MVEKAIEIDGREDMQKNQAEKEAGVDDEKSLIEAWRRSCRLKGYDLEIGF